MSSMGQNKNIKKSPNELKTFGDMFEYLNNVPNCRVNGKGFIVLDLKVFLDKQIERIELIPLEQRKTNLNCKSMKKSLKKVLDAYNLGDIEEVGIERKIKNNSIWTQ